jgi:hypothetical protein
MNVDYGTWTETFLVPTVHHKSHADWLGQKSSIHDEKFVCNSLSGMELLQKENKILFSTPGNGLHLNTGPLVLKCIVQQQQKPLNVQKSV